MSCAYILLKLNFVKINIQRHLKYCIKTNEYMNIFIRPQENTTQFKIIFIDTLKHIICCASVFIAVDHGIKY